MPDARIDYFTKWFAAGPESSSILAIGESGPHVANVARALSELGYRAPETSHFDNQLAHTVKSFQKDQEHKNTGGKVGPGTRKLLTYVALEKLGPAFFQKLTPAHRNFYQVFLTYAWDDTPRVNKLDQWLRDHDILVRRDIREFHAGQEFPNDVLKYLELSDKALIVYSHASQSRDWPAFERLTAETVEAIRRTPFLIYLLLDGAHPPQFDGNRIYIDAASKTLGQIGQELARAVARIESPHEAFEYDENAPL